jgi:hypothetical protein
MCPYNLSVLDLIKILGLFALLLTGEASAINEYEFSEECLDSSLQIGANYTRATFKADSQPTFFGNLGGLQGSYEYQPCNGFYGGLTLNWKQGKTKNSFAERKLVYVDVQERLGYTFDSCCKDKSITFFSGFGYRYLRHKLQQAEESSIKFHYHEFYVPVGLLSEYLFLCNWSIGLNFIWMPQIFPTVEIQPLKGAHWDLQNTLGNVLVELPVTYFFSSRCYSLIFKPFYERWEDGRSTAKTSSGEELGLPRNSYHFWGATLSFSFLF